MDRSFDPTFDFVEITADGNPTESYTGIYKFDEPNSTEIGTITSIPVVTFSNSLKIDLTTPGNSLFAVAHIRQ